MKFNLEKYWSSKIYKTYSLAVILYLSPFLLLVLFLIDSFTINLVGFPFLILFIVLLIPCSFIGLILSILGLRKSVKRNSFLNKDVGYASLLFGIMLLVSSLLAAAFISNVANSPV